MHFHLRPPEPPQPLPALTANLRRNAKFEVAEHASSVFTWRGDVTFDLCPWTYAAYRLWGCDVLKLCTKFERNRSICGGVIMISIFDLMTLNAVKTCGARFWDNFRQVWPSTTIIGVARWCTGCTCTPRAEKKMGAKFTGESCKCIPRQRVHPRGTARVQFFYEIWEIWPRGRGYLGSLGVCFEGDD